MLSFTGACTHPSHSLENLQAKLSSCHWPITQATEGFWLKSAHQKQDKVSREEWKKRSFHWKLRCSQQVHVARCRSGLETILTITKWKATFLTPGRSVSYSACYATPETSPGLSGEELRADVKSCTLSQMLLSSLGWVATCLTSELLNESLGRSGLVLSKHVSDFLQLLPERKVLVLKTSNAA